MHRRIAAGTLILAVAATQMGCGTHKSAATAALPTGTTVAGAPNPNAPEIVAPGDIPDNQVYVPFTPVSGNYTVKVPEAWARTDTQGVVTLTDHYNSIRLETSQAAAPTVASVKASEVPGLASSVNGFRHLAVQSISRPAGQAVLVTYQGGSAPNPVTGKVALLDIERYEFWHGGTKLVVTLSGAHGSDNVDPWKTVTNSIGWR